MTVRERRWSAKNFIADSVSRARTESVNVDSHGSFSCFGERERVG